MDLLVIALVIVSSISYAFSSWTTPPTEVLLWILQITGAIVLTYLICSLGVHAVEGGVWPPPGPSCKCLPEQWRATQHEEVRANGATPLPFCALDRTDR
jgi:hypothetical protein